jgi:hypothetical protein
LKKKDQLLRKEKKRKREMVTGSIGKSRKGTGDGWKIRVCSSFCMYYSTKYVCTAHGKEREEGSSHTIAKIAERDGHFVLWD